jgi:hypothetical protein
MLSKTNYNKGWGGLTILLCVAYNLFFVWIFHNNGQTHLPSIRAIKIKQTPEYCIIQTKNISSV